MNNHYHLVGTTSKEFLLPNVMEWLQRSANRAINDRARRINHLFGGPYKASLIPNEEYYAHAIRYVYQNPVSAGITTKPEDYRFSSLSTPCLPLVSPITGIESLVPRTKEDFHHFINDTYSAEANSVISLSLRKTNFKFPSRMPKELKHELLLRK